MISNTLPQTKRLKRTLFRTSRQLDFFSTKELEAQTGHQVREWPLVLIKELLDNALDACEESGVPPKMTISVDEDGVTIKDNGPGIAANVIADVIDFGVRVSSREAYVSPSRGAQGNALKTVLGMPFALGARGKLGAVRIEADGVRHVISVSIDRIRQEPHINHDQQKTTRSEGTSVFVPWPDRCCSYGDGPAHDSPRSILISTKVRFLQFAESFAWLNPHLSLTVEWLGDCHFHQATLRKWPKWLPRDPTDPHWYGVAEFERLIAAYVSHDAGQCRMRTVREFVTEFRGLSSTIKSKQVLEAVGLSRAKLADLADQNGIDTTVATKLLAAMQQHTHPVKPPALGIISKMHLAERCKAAGAEMKTFNYVKKTGTTDGLPWVIETAFAWRPRARSRLVITGVNWSPGILNPFRQLGQLGTSLDSILEEQRVGPDEPTILVLHVACPRVRYADRGKSSVIVAT